MTYGEAYQRIFPSVLEELADAPRPAVAALQQAVFRRKHSVLSLHRGRISWVRKAGFHLFAVCPSPGDVFRRPSPGLHRRHPARSPVPDGQVPAVGRNPRGGGGGEPGRLRRARAGLLRTAGPGARRRLCAAGVRGARAARDRAPDRAPHDGVGRPRACVRVGGAARRQGRRDGLAFRKMAGGAQPRLSGPHGAGLRISSTTRVLVARPRRCSTKGRRAGCWSSTSTCTRATARPSIFARRPPRLHLLDAWREELSRCARARPATSTSTCRTGRSEDVPISTPCGSVLPDLLDNGEWLDLVFYNAGVDQQYVI